MTDVPLRDYIERILEERSAKEHAHWVAAERALELSTTALGQRLEHMNQFRTQIQEERGLYLRKDQLEPLLLRISNLEKSGSDYGGRFWMLAIFIPTAVAVVTTLAVILVRHLLGGGG